MMYEPWTRSSAAYGSFTHEPLAGYRANPFSQTAPPGRPVSNAHRRGSGSAAPPGFAAAKAGGLPTLPGHLRPRTSGAGLRHPSVRGASEVGVGISGHAHGSAPRGGGYRGGGGGGGGAGGGRPPSSQRAGGMVSSASDASIRPASSYGGLNGRRDSEPPHAVPHPPHSHGLSHTINQPAHGAHPMAPPNPAGRFGGPRGATPSSGQRVQLGGSVSVLHHPPSAPHHAHGPHAAQLEHLEPPGGQHAAATAGGGDVDSVPARWKPPRPPSHGQGLPHTGQLHLRGPTMGAPGGQPGGAAEGGPMPLRPPSSGARPPSSGAGAGGLGRTPSAGRIPSAGGVAAQPSTPSGSVLAGSSSLNASLNSSHGAAAGSAGHAAAPKYRVEAGAATIKGSHPGKAANQDAFLLENVANSANLSSAALHSSGGGGGGSSQAKPPVAGVFDGHGELGHRVSNFVVEKLRTDLVGTAEEAASAQLTQRSFDHKLVSSFDRANRALSASGIDVRHSGTTACTAQLAGDRLIVANVGDSRAVLGRWDPASGQYVARDLSVDHKPDSDQEHRRITRSGGRVAPMHVPGHGFVGPARVWDRSQRFGLATSRAFGDTTHAAHNGGSVIAEPDVVHHRVTPDDKCVVLGTDGVWDRISSQEAISIAARYPDPKMASEAIATEAKRRWEATGPVRDDITAVVMRIAPLTPSADGGSGGMAKVSE